MDNFKAVYKILSALEKSMDLPEVDMEAIDHKALDISKERWCRYIEMMLDVGYIKGASVRRDITGNLRVDCSDLRITLKGLEYLQENTIMQRMYNAAKGLKEILPGI